jgi:DNA polymerase-3 subunit epsilon/oligoribonuclease
VLGIFLDSETNGLNFKKHRILEIAFVIVDVLNGTIKDRFHSPVSLTPEEWKRSDPESLKVNGFTWEQASLGPSSEAVGQNIQKIFAHHRIRRGQAVFICQNPSFDRAFFSQLVDADSQEKLLWPYHWLDLASMFWTLSIKRKREGSGKFPWETGLSKDRIAIANNLPCEESPHRALNGAEHLLLCYKTIVGFPET